MMLIFGSYVYQIHFLAFCTIEHDYIFVSFREENEVTEDDYICDFLES